MIYNTEKHISQAKKLIKSGDNNDLYHACLELRYAIEKIAYQKLKLRLGKVSSKEISAWQPRRALEILSELVDEHLEHDSSLRIAQDDELGQDVVPRKFVPIAEIKGVNPKKLGKHWQKLGSYLHIQMPKSKNAVIKKHDATNLKDYLAKVIEYLEQFNKSSADFHLSRNITVECSACNQKIIRNITLLKDRDIVYCQNPECSATYQIHKQEKDGFRFQPYICEHKCHNCEHVMVFEVGPLLKLKYEQHKTVACAKCKTEYVIHWKLAIAEKEDVDPDDR